MSQQTDRARRALHALADGDLPLMESCFAESFVFHSAGEGEPVGRSGLHHRAMRRGANGQRHGRATTHPNRFFFDANAFRFVPVQDPLA